MKARLLVIELHHLGDAVLSIPFLQAASREYEVAVFCAGGVAEMLREFVPQVETINAEPKWTARLGQGAGELRKREFAVTVCAWSDARADLVARLTGTPRRLGFPMTEVNYYASQRAWRKRRLKIGQFIEWTARAAGFDLLTEPLHRSSAMDSHLSNWERIAASLKLELNLEPPWLTLPEMAKPKGGASARPLWVVHPGGRLPTKRWPLERFQALLREVFARKKWPVLVIEGPGEGKLEPAGPHQKNLSCETHLELASALASADAVLCNDSYAAHLAAALGKRVFTIFGSGEPAWFGPFRNGERVIQKDVCPHHPCVDRCVMPSVVCLEAVTEKLVASFLEGSAGET